jgi:hypothetical protein
MTYDTYARAKAKKPDAAKVRVGSYKDFAKVVTTSKANFNPTHTNIQIAASGDQRETLHCVQRRHPAYPQTVDPLGRRGVPRQGACHDPFTGEIAYKRRNQDRFLRRTSGMFSPLRKR